MNIVKLTDSVYTLNSLLIKYLLIADELQRCIKNYWPMYSVQSLPENIYQKYLRILYNNVIKKNRKCVTCVERT